MKLLFHCCCAPCSVQCVNALRGEDIEPELFWYNPNIHPSSEYSLRRKSITEFAANEKLNLQMTDEYGLRPFIEAVFPTIKSSDNRERCKICYKLRLEKTASAAVNGGFSAFSTSLLISPYQHHDAIKAVGEEIAAKYGIDFLYRDFRPLFRDGQFAARAMGYHMQKYCGCVFSEEERHLRGNRK